MYAKEERIIDAAAEPDDYVQVELPPELGVPGSMKLYVHVNGQTVLRICKLRARAEFSYLVRGHPGTTNFVADLKETDRIIP